MHENALRFETRDPPGSSGCLLAGLGLVCFLALRTSPAAALALALALAGAVAHLPAVTAFYPGRGGLGLLSAASALPLLMYAPAVLAVPTPALRWFWLGSYLLAAAVAPALAQRGWSSRMAARRVREAPVEVLSELVLAEASGRGWLRLSPAHALVAAERLLLVGNGRAAEEIVDRLVGSCVVDGEPDRLGRRIRRLRSLRDLLQGEAARAIAQVEPLLAGKLDMEEGRQYRAWCAYLALAAGEPERAAALADQAIGPHPLAGEEWQVHCRSLQAWALVEAGKPGEAAELARLQAAGMRPEAPGLGPLRAIQAWAELRAGNRDAAAAWLRADGGGGSAGPDSFLLSLGAEMAWAMGEPGRARELAQAAVRCAVPGFPRCHAARLAAALTPDPTGAL